MRPGLSRSSQTAHGDRIDSTSIGNPAGFCSLQVLEQGLAALPTAPRDSGRVTLLVRRALAGLREVVNLAPVTPELGLVGDAWGRQRRPSPRSQLAVMQADIADLIANGQPLALFGDNLFLDLDLSIENLPQGSRLRAGTALLEVTPEPHQGCAKFRERLGHEALRFISQPRRRPLNLRGVYMQAIEGGVISVDDIVNVISRPR